MALPASRAVTRTSTGWLAVTRVAKNSTWKWWTRMGAIVVVVVDGVVEHGVDELVVGGVGGVGGGPVGTRIGPEKPRTVDPADVSAAETVWLPGVARLAPSEKVRRPLSPAVKV